MQGPTWGYPTEGAYYRDASSCDPLLAVRVPLFAINANDDPVRLIARILFLTALTLITDSFQRGASSSGIHAKPLCGSLYDSLRWASQLVRVRWREVVR